MNRRESGANAPTEVVNGAGPQASNWHESPGTSLGSPRALTLTLVVLLVVATVLGTALVAASPGLAKAGGGPTEIAVSVTPATVPPPLHGLVTTCSSASSCDFAFNTPAGTGWATASPPMMSFQLPGEAKASSNISYQTYTKKLTGTYTYWTVGNFEGTDINTGKVVYGTTNTNFTITCVGHSGRGGGCTYTYTTDNGTIVVDFTQAEQTSTSVSCSPSSIGSGSSTVCTATVTDTANGSATPTGNVSFSSSYGSTSSFSTGGLCTLISGSCSVTFTAPDELLGTVPISASYLGVSAFYPSAGRTSIYVGSSSTGGTPFWAVYFSESGLPLGTSWSTTLGGLLLSSTNGSIVFEVQNGTYNFTVGTQTGFTLAPSGGTVTVAGANVSVSVHYAPVTYPITFSATGLPVGKSWSVALDGAYVNGTAPLVTFNATNGSHTYLVRGPAGFRVAGFPPEGSLTVNGAPVTETVGFVKGSTYAIAFAEIGLPKNRTWCISFAGLECTARHALRFAKLTPGAYPYSVMPIHGQVITAKLLGATTGLNGTLNLTSRSDVVHLRYAYPYEVTFTELGLPTGTNWSVTVKGVTGSSTGTTISFWEPNGTYRYGIGPETGYSMTGSPLRARVAGGPSSVVVTFRFTG